MEEPNNTYFLNDRDKVSLLLADVLKQLDENNHIINNLEKEIHTHKLEVEQLNRKLEKMNTMKVIVMMKFYWRLKKKLSKAVKINEKRRA
ncbi:MULTISPECIES: hypothetical protein [Paenibacillus]|uniref:hypothetical protein n=1 Tax=Paenibacillus TaxID=44249 RepID=UPI00038FB2BD|nr:MULTISPECIES: hypothetical protein [Paenibacillus]KKC49285.1 hypothetical protein VE23_22955 [Paenibacillus sp. D9]CDN41911.1 hypothetical protein BN871_AO_00330 [Paenibacillus sp. P22]